MDQSTELLILRSGVRVSPGALLNKEYVQYIVMLSTKLRLRLEFIASRIEKGEPVELTEMIWADKLAKANRSAGEILRRARRKATMGDVPEDGLDNFLNQMDLGDPDPTNHLTEDNTLDEIVEWFKQEQPEDWRQRD